MGNQHEIRQLPLKEYYGVVLDIKINKEVDILNIIPEQECTPFYTYYVPANKESSIINLDFDDFYLVESEKHRLVIQSGGKMWCGYTDFCNHIKVLAQYLEDSEFLVGDEIDFIDKFTIKENQLYIERVHSGYWLDIDTFVEENYLKINTAHDNGN